MAVLSKSKQARKPENPNSNDNPVPKKPLCIAALQWNVNGLRSRRIDLENLIKEYSPATMLLQEVRLPYEVQECQEKGDPIPSYACFKGYKGYFRLKKNGQNGVALYVRNNIFHTPINLNSPLQTLAAKITFREKVFIVSSHYTPCSQSPKLVQFQNIINKFDKPYLMGGDYNAHSDLWCASPVEPEDYDGLPDLPYESDSESETLGEDDSESETTKEPPTAVPVDLTSTPVDPTPTPVNPLPTSVRKSASKASKRGETLEKLIQNNGLGVLNCDTPTFIRSNNVLDLMLAEGSIFMDFEAEVLSDPHSSDHHPILIHYTGDFFEVDKLPRYNFKKADIPAFQELCRKSLNRDTDFKGSPDKMKSFTEQLVDISDENIPKSSPFRKEACKPWFNKECQDARRQRNQDAKRCRLCPDANNRMRAKISAARARRIFKKNKRQSWRNYVSKLNSKTPTTKIWNMIRKITGKNVPSHLLHLKDSKGNTVEEIDKISDYIGKTYEHNSSSKNYPDEFQPIKKEAEKRNLNFNTKTKLKYNAPFRLKDLKRAIKKGKDTSPGPDGIPYKLLKLLPDETLLLLLDLINEYWTSDSFPDSWREAFLLPVPKPEKDRTNPNNFRPIALTSCLCKTMERMVNERLIHYLEETGRLSKHQAGFRSERCTTDQLASLESFLRDAMTNKDHVVAVFFDLSKAYDTAWKHGIMQDLYDMELRGNLPKFVLNFMTDRTFSILLNANIGHTKFTQEEGVPQGAILSTTLFNVKLNDIAKQISGGTKCSLYVDDFVIYIRSSTPEGTQRTLQENINRVRDWCIRNGFNISEDKTVAMHFCNCWSCKQTGCYDPVLRLGSSDNSPIIPYKFEKKFLGLIWDKKLTFISHIADLKKRCNKAMNLIRVLAHTNWGADTRTLLRLFRAVIRSKMDYGCIAFMNGNKKALASLDVLHRDGLRLCLGAFKSSPKESLYVEANELPLGLRREELAMRYALKIRSHPNNPTFDALFGYHEADNSIAISIKNLFEEAEIDLNKVMSSKIPKHPVCYSSDLPIFNFTLAETCKADTHDYEFKAKFLDVVDSFYPTPFDHVYTDGSKEGSRAGFGMVSPFGSTSVRCCDDSSIFTAELEAVHRALRHIRLSFRTSKRRKFVVFSDSKSVLEALQNKDSKNPLVTTVTDMIEDMLLEKIVLRFCWIPGHVGIKGNDRADQLAKDGRNEAQTIFEIPYTDLIPEVASFIKSKWQQRWDTEVENKLHAITPEINPYHLIDLSRKDEVILHRIRIGHTRLTHSYRMERGGDRNTPKCIFCEEDVDLTIAHVMIECTGLYYSRINHFVAADMKDLFDRIHPKQIIGFLKEANIYCLI